MLKVCPDCKGADTDLRPCTTCKGIRMVSDSPPGGADDEPQSRHVDGLPSPGSHAMFEARTALKEAALNYAAARLLSHASADHINLAFAKLEEAADEFTYTKHRQSLTPASAGTTVRSK
jgi:hypothetical protein